MKNLVSEISLKYESKVKSADRELIRDSQSSEKIFRSIERYNANMQMFECFYCMFLNRANKVLSIMLISEGGTAGTVADIKKILMPAILQNCSGIIVSHNHPSGSNKPSQTDIDLTKNIKDAAKLIDVNLLDHLILCENSYYSFADEGLL